jgi:hypothetical protein
MASNFEVLLAQATAKATSKTKNQKQVLGVIAGVMDSEGDCFTEETVLGAKLALEAILTTPHPLAIRHSIQTQLV